MVRLFILITDENKKAITTEIKHQHDFVCPLSGESFKVRGKFWNHIKNLKLKPIDLDLDIKEDIKEENEGNIENLFHIKDIEYLWTSYFKGKITITKLQHLVGIIDLELYKDLIKIMNSNIDEYIKENNSFLGKEVTAIPCSTEEESSTEEECSTEDYEEEGEMEVSIGSEEVKDEEDNEDNEVEEFIEKDINEPENDTEYESKSKNEEDKSFIIFKYDVSNIILKDNEYLINYQYSDGDYSWILIKTKKEIECIESKIKKVLINSKSYDKVTKILRLTKIRDKKVAEEFGYNVDTFDSKLQYCIKHKSLSTLEYLKILNIIDTENESLYNSNSEECNKIAKKNINSQHLPIKDIICDTTIENSVMKDNIFAMNGDCNEKLNNVKDKSIQTICIDPPYNIGKDSWDNIENYNEWLTDIIVNLEKKLRDNGSMFIFHNDMEAISELMISIKEKTNLKFIQMITWNKRFEGSKKKGFLDGYVVKKKAHKWELMAEYILFYTFDNTYKYKQERINKKVCAKDIQKEVPSITGGMTGWYGNIEGGLNHPTKERMVPITKHLGLEYEDVVPKFINQKEHHSVWNFDSAKKHKNCTHITPKPVDLLENIIKHTTDEGDVLLDCFAGTGSLGKASLNTNRKCVLIEKDEEYFEFIKGELSTNS